MKNRMNEEFLVFVLNVLKWSNPNRSKGQTNGVKGSKPVKGSSEVKIVFIRRYRAVRGSPVAEAGKPVPASSTQLHARSATFWKGEECVHALCTVH